MTIDFSRRSELPELMDSDDTDFDTFRACLADLSTVNHLTFAYRPTLNFLDKLLKAGRLPRNRPLVILDVGSGYGDMLRKVDNWAQRRGLKVKLIGVDRNPWSTRSSQDATPPGRPVQFATADIFEFKPLPPADVVISSLFTHHLDDKSLVRFIEWMEKNSRLAWFVNDLHRHPIPYHVFRLASRALRFHEFVQHDGPVSIARAFDADDWRTLIERAGLTQTEAEVRWVFPFRLCVSRLK